ncbi:MAG: hypothetical protein KDJ65_06820 [Anaerolineae bacterium]|nr:hypothetical protein [Anaerolineae bacterium]
MKSKFLAEILTDRVGATAIGLDGGGGKDGPNLIASPVAGVIIGVDATDIVGQRGRVNVIGQPAVNGCFVDVAVAPTGCLLEKFWFRSVFSIECGSCHFDTKDKKFLRTLFTTDQNEKTEN